MRSVSSISVSGFRFQVSGTRPRTPSLEKGGGVAEQTHIFIQESLAAFMGDVQEQRPSGAADTYPYLGKPGGFFGGRAGAASLRRSGHISLFRKA